MRVGLVGCGFIGRVHGWALWALRKAELVDLSVTAVCDGDPERAKSFADQHHAQACSLDALLDDVDVVYVCTPTVMHRTIVEAAADRGKAIFCEKPLAASLSEAQAVADALARVSHQVGLVMRAAPVFVALRDAIADGRYGRVMTAVLRDDQYFPIRGQYGSTWRADADVAGGGALIEHSIHDLDILRFMLGDPTDVSCRTASFFGHEGIEDVAVATLAFPDGPTATLTSVWHQVMSRPSTRRLEVFCERAFLWTEDDNTGPLHVQTSDGDEAVECPLPSWVDEIPVPEAARRPLGLYAEASRRFLECVSSGSTGSPGGGDAMRAHRLVDAAYRSAEAGGAPLNV